VKSSSVVQFGLERQVRVLGYLTTANLVVEWSEDLAIDVSLPRCWETTIAGIVSRLA